MPGLASLAEIMLLETPNGAAAVWGPTGFSINSEATQLSKEFFKAAKDRGQRALGEDVRRAQASFSKSGGLRYMLEIYNLLGDPALNLR